jgi:hypothetical protein
VARGVADLDELARALDETLANPPGPTAWARPVAAAPAVADQAERLLEPGP